MKIYQDYPLARPDQVRCLVRKGRDSYALDIGRFDIPRYTALSYTWGDSKPMHQITIAGSNLKVSQNLFDFLNSYVPPGGNDFPPGSFWIDQICINQADVIERNTQVKRMNLIYKMAKRVLVWLGCDAEMVEAARQIRDHEIQDARTVATILRHPYFTRVWIVQEIALARYVDVLCGNVTLKLSDLQIAATWMGGRPSWGVSPAALSLLHEHDVFRFSRSVGVARGVLEKRSESPTLQYCIAQYCLNHCQDLRDKVYGLLGMTPERWRVDLDYEKPVLIVYIDAMVAMCEELFDRLDPECFYNTNLDRRSGQNLYTQTILILARAMGISKHQIQGLKAFLQSLLDIYLDTPKRMVQYEYNGLLPDIPAPSLREANEDLLDPIPDPIEPETSDPHGAVPQPRTPLSADKRHSNTVVRRNPALRDVISDLGLQLAQEETQRPAHRTPSSLSLKSLQQSLRVSVADSAIADTDRWWFDYNGKRHYFNCPSCDG